MICELCWNFDENLIEIAGEEGVQLNIGTLLHKYFRLCFENEPASGVVCRKCWVKVDLFHEFYTCIEKIHKSVRDNENIFVAKIQTQNEFLHGILNHHSQQLTEDTRQIENVKIDHDDEKSAIKKRRRANKVGRGSNLSKVLNSKKKRKRGRPRKMTNENENSLKDHFICDICKLLFLSKCTLIRHIKLIHINFEFKCNHFKCVDSFQTFELLKKHENCRHAKVECPHCKKMFQQNFIAQHIRLSHDKRKQVLCITCGHISINAQRDTVHQYQVHTVHERLQCDICKEWCANKNAIKEHIKVRHVQQPTACSICGKISVNKKAMVKHRKSHYEWVREKNKCNVCQKTFRDRISLRDHSNIHTGKPDAYRCKLCDRTFRFSSSFSTHRKKAHPELFASQ